MKDPTSSVSHKPKESKGSHKTPSAVPHFSSTDYEKVETNLIPDFYDDQEKKYMERLKLRAKLNQLAPDSVPAASDFESMLSVVQKELNDMYRDSIGKGDTAKSWNAGVTARANLEILYSRFGTRNLFNIASDIASARLQKQGIREIEKLVESPSDAVNVILGGNDSDTNNYRKMSMMQKENLRTMGENYHVRNNLFGYSREQIENYAKTLA